MRVQREAETKHLLYLPQYRRCGQSHARTKTQHFARRHRGLLSAPEDVSQLICPQRNYTPSQGFAALKLEATGRAMWTAPLRSSGQVCLFPSRLPGGFGS